MTRLAQTLVAILVSLCASPYQMWRCYTLNFIFLDQCSFKCHMCLMTTHLSMLIALNSLAGNLFLHGYGLTKFYKECNCLHTISSKASKL